MFNSKTKQMFANHQSLLSSATRMVGDLYFSGDLFLEGCLKGNIYAEEGKPAKLVVAESSVVEGEIHAPNIVINGKVHGAIYSSKHIELAAKAMVEGSIHYNLIEMVKGSHLIGQLVCTGMNVETETSTDVKGNPKIIVKGDVRQIVKIEPKADFKPEVKMNIHNS